METKFNSQICTSREQSERLLKLGLKKETADMTIVGVFVGTNEDGTLAFDDVPNAHPPMLRKDIPAWSLHRLIEMMPTIIKRHQQVWTLSLNGAGVFYLNKDMVSIVEALADNLFDNIIGCIEWLIKEEYFNKEYLA